MVSLRSLRDPRKGLALLRSLAASRRSVASEREPRPSVDVTRFEVPSSPSRLASIGKDKLIECYWRVHPRFNFFKSTAPHAHVLDVGAGSGGLPLWRQYLPPDRSDIRLSGVDLAKPVTSVLYEAFQIADLNDGVPFPAQAFDAIVASHVLEHTTSPAAVLADLARTLRQGGLIYVEIPSPETKSLPTAAQYRAAGWPITISNFYDDATHRDTPDQQALVAMARASALQCLQAGRIAVPYLDQAMIAKGIALKDAELLTYGYWSATRWATFAIFEKTEEGLRNLSVRSCRELSSQLPTGC